MKYVIQCNQRSAERAPCFFAAWHSFSQYFVREVSKARKFDTQESAAEYANKELFTKPEAFTIIPVSY